MHTSSKSLLFFVRNLPRVFSAFWLLRVARRAGVVFGLVAAASTFAASPNTTLVFDLNNAAPDIVAMRAALADQKLGGRLIVVPSAQRFPAARRMDISASQDRFNAAQARALDCTKDDGINGCQRVWAEMRELELARLRTTGSYGLGELIEDIQQGVININANIDTVVISGHHSGGYFGGEISRLDVMDLQTLRSVFPTVFLNVRTVLLLGCETGSEEMIREVFAPLFPSARVIMGSDGVAPLRDDPRNLRFVRAAVLAQPTLAGARTVGDASRIYRKLQRQPWPVALLWNREHYFTRESHSAMR